ncbi:putative effector of murein hydrolase LrgA (UPF0299 family) [Desmospora profundinema]|uniref:Effector of murein hydrolase LrgA (UPF0299 family) n=1 Tax=Desmospora profundinema TaxID=1571184 RepID=A0ABU1IS71_9BACL|nr:putative effector of murein hydrolase LrgA (UPF0299 family) [Desmospora profundinema]
MEHLSLIREGGWGLLLVVFVHTLLVMAVSAAATRWLAIRKQRGGER